MNFAFPLGRTRSADGLYRRRFTVAEVEAMVRAGIIDEDERVELIGGELVPMSPKGSRHEAFKMELNRLWGRIMPEELSFVTETTLWLSEDSYLEPDFVVFPREVDIADLRAEHLLLVVEIGDRSLRYDLGRKAKLYAQFGVKELWVIDAPKTRARAFTGPAEKGYTEKRDVGAGERLAPRFARDCLSFAVADLDRKPRKR